ncbi:hypothetical protein KJ644_04310 [Candidatus Dependentiae bacterium]|nr:hypothetical protein [Candidatus Dependentiae bacterium]MBU4387662.1 hypothetical protein [Candidatus Dependentiae bacterium]MCG2756049.1 hypothetical protein [Candidatus Dependentiae bacterium]
MNNKKLFLILLLSTTSLIYTKELENAEILSTENPIQDNTADQNLTEIKKLEKQASKNSEAVTEEKNIYLNFENAELSNFINYISEIKKINLVPDKALEGVKISLTIREPLTVDKAWDVFLTVLEMSNFSIIKNGDVHVIVPRNTRTKQPLPAYINVPVDSLPDRDENIRYVTFLENIDVGSIQGLLDGMLSPEHSLIPYPDVNGFIIVDKSYNIKAAMKVILALDQTGLKEAVYVLKLKRVNAIDVKKLFEEGGLLGKSEGLSPLARLLGKQAESNLQYFSSTTKIIAEERTNSLILLGTKNSVDKIVEFIVNHIDTELREVTSPLHIYELQNTDAEQIKTILEKVTDVSILGEQAQKYGAVRDGVKYFKAMNFAVDKDGNRLVVSSTDKQDWQLLEKTIKDLDKPQPQVAIETMFVTISAEDNKFLGGAIRNKKSGQIGKHINFQSPNETGVMVTADTPDSGYKNLLGNMINAVTDALGSTILTFGPDTNIWGAFKALSYQTGTSVLTQPFITVSNKVTGNINYGEKIYITKEEIMGSTSVSKQPDEAKTDIKITPQINIDGMVRLHIEITIDDFIDKTGSHDKKSVTTDVTVANGQVIALGGFIKNEMSDNFIKTPILGDIPILGWFFKQKSKDLVKKHIFIFISPTIIKPRGTPGTNHYAKMKLEQARKSVDEVTDSGDIKDPIDTWFFTEKGKKYSNKIVDFANGKHQPTTVDIKNDPYYRSNTERTDDIDAYQNNVKEAKKESNIIALNKSQKNRFNLKSRKGLEC